MKADRAGTLAKWEQMLLSAYQAYTGPEPIPGAEIFVERFDEDPFLFVSDAEGEEICCIGYWNTDFQP